MWNTFAGGEGGMERGTLNLLNWILNNQQKGQLRCDLNIWFQLGLLNKSRVWAGRALIKAKNVLL